MYHRDIRNIKQNINRCKKEGKEKKLEYYKKQLTIVEAARKQLIDNVAAEAAAATAARVAEFVADSEEEDDEDTEFDYDMPGDVKYYIVTNNAGVSTRYLLEIIPVDIYKKIQAVQYKTTPDVITSADVVFVSMPCYYHGHLPMQYAIQLTDGIPTDVTNPVKFNIPTPEQVSARKKLEKTNGKKQVSTAAQQPQQSEEAGIGMTRRDIQNNIHSIKSSNTSIQSVTETRADGSSTTTMNQVSQSTCEVWDLSSTTEFEFNMERKYNNLCRGEKKDMFGLFGFKTQVSIDQVTSFLKYDLEISAWSFDKDARQHLESLLNRPVAQHLVEMAYWYSESEVMQPCIGIKPENMCEFLYYKFVFRVLGNSIIDDRHKQDCKIAGCCGELDKPYEIRCLGYDTDPADSSNGTLYLNYHFRVMREGELKSKWMNVTFRDVCPAFAKAMLMDQPECHHNFFACAKIDMEDKVLAARGQKRRRDDVQRYGIGAALSCAVADGD